MSATRRYILNFGPVTIAPKQTATIENTPIYPFLAGELINTGDIEGLSLVGIKVGDKSQVAGGTAPLIAFSEPVPVKFDACAPGEMIAFEIRNDSDEPRNFKASILSARPTL